MNTTEQYLENLVPLAARLIAAIHDEGPADAHGALIACRALPCPPTIDPHTALAFVLAAAVDPERPLSDLLAWTTTLAGHTTTPAPEANPLAVEMGITGALPAHALNAPELEAVVLALYDRGWTEPDIRHHLPDADRDTIGRHLNRAQSRAARSRATRRKAIA